MIKLSSYEAAIIMLILREVDSREVFRNDPRGSLVHYENMTRTMAESLKQLLEESQNRQKNKKVA